MVRMYKLARKAFAKFRWKRLLGARGSKEETEKGKKGKKSSREREIITNQLNRKMKINCDIVSTKITRA